jgi:hypothetical protein
MAMDMTIDMAMNVDMNADVDVTVKVAIVRGVWFSGIQHSIDLSIDAQSDVWHCLDVKPSSPQTRARQAGRGLKSYMS